MRKWITLLMTLLVTGSSVSYANASSGQVTLEAGYRRDNLTWRSRFPSDSPFLKTNTRFKDVNIFQIGVHGRSTLGYNVYIRASAYWGWVLDGDFRQSVSTYFEPEHYSELDFGFHEETRNLLDDRYVYGAGIAIGYPFYFCDCTMAVAPVIGYSIDEQNFRVNDRGLDIAREDSIFFPVHGDGCCSNKFFSRWYGPFVGVDFNYRPFNECWNLFAEIEYHWGNFNGRRSIGNRGHFDHFGFENERFHSHDAFGWVFAAGADYDFSDCWTVGFSVKFQDWSATRHHRHRGDDDFGDSDSYGSGEHSSFSGRQRHNQKWHSYAINLTVGREF
jgi:opacity protein-like surface antigen